jgi:hypothetical protein
VGTKDSVSQTAIVQVTLHGSGVRFFAFQLETLWFVKQNVGLITNYESEPCGRKRRGIMPGNFCAFSLWE